MHVYVSIGEDFVIIVIVSEIVIVIVFPQFKYFSSSGVRCYYRQETIGIPLLARLPDPFYGSDIRNAFLNILNPFLKPDGDILDVFEDDSGNCANEDSNKEDDSCLTVWDNDSDTDRGTGGEAYLDTDFKFYLTEGKEIEMNQLLVVSEMPTVLGREIPVVHVLWSDKMINKYNTHFLNTLPAVFNFFPRLEESVSLYKCLEAFQKEEPLGPEDMWLVPVFA